MSFAHEDHAIAEQIDAGLRRAGIETFTYSTLTPGSNISQAIGHEIEDADSFIFLVSRNYVRSEWTTIELAAALADVSSRHARPMVPVLVDADMDPTIDVPPLLSSYRWLDLRGGVTDDALAPLIGALRRPMDTPEISDQQDAQERFLQYRRQALRAEMEMYAQFEQRVRWERRTSLLSWSVSALAIVAIGLIAVTFFQDGPTTPALSVALALMALGSAVGTVVTSWVDRRTGRTWTTRRPPSGRERGHDDGAS